MPVQTITVTLSAPSNYRSSSKVSQTPTTDPTDTDHRGTGKQYINCYPTVRGGKIYIRPRAGWALDTLVLNASTTNFTTQGLFTWNVDNETYSSVSSTMYKDTTANGSAMTGAAINFNTYFTSIDTGTQYVVALNNDTLFTYDTSFTQTIVTDPDFPSNLVPGVVSLDGFIFVMDDQGFIYNSNINDPTAWNPEDFINAEYEPDKGVSLRKLGNYVVALGSNTTQFFYNASTSPGSPLRPIKQANRNIGCIDGDTVAHAEDSLFWVAQSDAPGNLGVVMAQGTTITKISPPWIDEIVTNFATSVTKGQPLNAESRQAHAFRRDGELFYLIGNPNVSVCYNATVKEWSLWYSETSATDGLHTRRGFIRSQPDQGYSGYSKYKILTSYEFSATNSVASIWEMDGGDAISLTDPGTTRTAQIPGVRNFKPVVVTDNIRFNDRSNKFLYKLEVLGDKTSTEAPLGVLYSDDDGETWVNAGDVDMNDFRPQLHALGRFQERIFLLQMNSVNHRITSLEMTLEVGTNAEGTNA